MEGRMMDIGKALLAFEIAAGIALGIFVLGCFMVAGRDAGQAESYYEIETEMTEFEGSLDEIGLKAS